MVHTSFIVVIRLYLCLCVCVCVCVCVHSKECACTCVHGVHPCMCVCLTHQSSSRGSRPCCPRGRGGCTGTSEMPRPAGSNFGPRMCDGKSWSHSTHKYNDKNCCVSRIRSTVVMLTQLRGDDLRVPELRMVDQGVSGPAADGILRWFAQQKLLQLLLDFRTGNRTFEARGQRHRDWHYPRGYG